MYEQLDLDNLTYDQHPYGYQGHKVISKVTRLKNEKIPLE